MKQNWGVGVGGGGWLRRQSILNICHRTASVTLGQKVKIFTITTAKRQIFHVLNSKPKLDHNRGVATSMIARHKKPRHDLIVVLHLKSCGAAEKSLRGCIRRAIIEVATPRLRFILTMTMGEFPGC